MREIELLADAIGTMAALRAVTHTAAGYLRAERDLGAVVPGRYADFLVLGGDPIRDVRELRSLEQVYRGGVAHRPEELIARVPRHEPAGLHH